MPVRKNWGQRKLPADLEAELDKVRAAAPPPPTEDPIYKYLARVYELWDALEGATEWKEAVKRYHKTHRLRIKKDYIRFIIEQTAGNHVTDQRKHKYTVTLQYALQKGLKPAGVVAFIKKNGGINECVELWQKKYGNSRKTRKKKTA
jgi:hypothetical protein